MESYITELHALVVQADSGAVSKAELVAGEIARVIGLRVPEIVLVELDPRKVGDWLNACYAASTIQPGQER